MVSSSTRFLTVTVVAPRVYRSGVTQRRSFVDRCTAVLSSRKDPRVCLGLDISDDEDDELRDTLFARSNVSDEFVAKK